MSAVREERKMVGGRRRRSGGVGEEGELVSEGIVRDTEGVLVGVRGLEERVMRGQDKKTEEY